MDVVFLDFAKAFDKVPHKRLLVKLRANGVSGRVLNCIENWLPNRKRVV
jgi:ribonuclease P/MRP protein subunit RPP40